MRRKILAANWKMNLNTTKIEDFVARLKSLATSDWARTEIVVFPPAPYLLLLKNRFEGTNYTLGAQCTSEHVSGAYTGELSPAMAADCGCKWVLCGHSERRQYHGETDALIGKKAQRASENGCTPMICVGESLSERTDNKTDEVICTQLRGAFAEFQAKDAEFAIAYEPVWAIGTGRVADAAEADRVHAIIRGELTSLLGPEKAQATQILYGGSVRPENALEFMSKPNVDGVLVGGASLAAESFSGIIAAGARIN